MKILITGLALSRNLGAPAMALSLIAEVTKRLPQATFVMAVSSADMKQEKEWFDYYNNIGFKIDKLVPRSTITSYLINVLPIKKMYQYITGKYKLPAYKKQKNSRFWLQQHSDYLDAIKESDLIISMFGISYIGDGVHKFTDGLNDYSSIYYAKKYGIPYTRFTQSYGPFDDKMIRYFAKKEFDYLPFVYARGKHSASYCREITKDKSKVYDIPDLAVLLKKADDSWTNKYLEGMGLNKKDYIVVSPSSVIYSMPKRVTGSIGEKHVESISLIVKTLIEQGNKILLLPHMYSDKKWACDREICYKVFEKLSNTEKHTTRIVEEDIDTLQAKSLISFSKLSIVSRYHALVAAVSTSTPVITIGWNIKYYDLMEYYDIEEMSIDTRENEPLEIMNKTLEKMKFYEEKTNVLRYNKMKKNVEKIVETSVENLCHWIENETR